MQKSRGDSTGADLGQVVDLPVVVQRQVPMVLTVQRPVETFRSCSSSTNSATSLSLLSQRQVPMVLTVQRPLETSQLPQVQFIDKFGGISVVVDQRQEPMVLAVQRPVEIPQVPQLQFIDKFVDIPVVVVMARGRLRMAGWSSD